MLYPVELRAQTTDLRWLFSRLATSRPKSPKKPNLDKNQTPNPLRHKSGRYYARAYVGGKKVWQPLGTSHFSVANVKLAKFLEHIALCGLHREHSAVRLCSIWHRSAKRKSLRFVCFGGSD